jgi:hypothetical protein
MLIFDIFSFSTFSKRPQFLQRLVVNMTSPILTTEDEKKKFIDRQKQKQKQKKNPIPWVVFFLLQ